MASAGTWGGIERPPPDHWRSGATTNTSQLYLIITTRADPLLPLSRLRAPGKLTELGAADLCFTSAEVEVFLNQEMELELSAQATLALCERTEDWITGL